MFTSHRQHCVAENTMRRDRCHSEVPRFHQRDEESHTDNQLPNFDVIPNRISDVIPNRRAAAVRACPERLSLAKEPNGNLLSLFRGRRAGAFQLSRVPRPSFAWAGILISPRHTFIPTVTSNLVHSAPVRSSCSQPGSELRTQKLPPNLGLRGNFHLTLLSDVFCEEKIYAVDSREFPKEGGRHIPQ
jgi:hypothetical protein